MGICEELESRLNGDIVLLDTSAMTPSIGNRSLTQVLYEGIEGLNSLDPVNLTCRIHRIQEIEHIIKNYPVMTIPEVHIELDRYIHTLQQQNTYISREVQRNKDWIEKDDYHYYRELLESIFQYKTAVRNCAQRLKNGLGIDRLKDNPYSPYNQFMHTARLRSKDLAQKTRERKSDIEKPLHLGEQLETDRHLVATTFIVAYDKPITLVTGDYGIAELTRRMYECIVQGKLSDQPAEEQYLIPPHTINVFNVTPYDLEMEFKCREIVNRIEPGELF